jgi:hypothetical protein
MIENVDSVSLSGLVVTFTKVSTKMTNEKVTEKCIGQMGAAIRANGSVEFSMAMDA